jgi:hypothetical protein
MNFASLLFSPPQLSIEKSTQSVEPTNSPFFPETSDQDPQMPRMRGQVGQHNGRFKTETSF